MRYPIRTILLAISLIAAAARADTIVSGTVSGSWTKADGPFRVAAACTVRAGDHLAIGPGVDVLFDADVPFVVLGRLEAIGAEGDSVRFMRGAAAEWGGLRLENRAAGEGIGDSSTLRFVRVSEAYAHWKTPGEYNRAWGGGLYADRVRLVVSRSVFSGNKVDGPGGAAYIAGPASFDSCAFIANSAQKGGALAFEDSDVSVRNSVFRRNHSESYVLEGGSAVSLSGSGRLLLKSCTITQNSGDFVIALDFWLNPDLTVDQCTISGNEFGAIRTVNAASVRVRNSILWNPQAGSASDHPEIYRTSWGDCGYYFEWMCEYPIAEVAVENSDVKGGWPGVRNIDAHPVFADTANGDYALAPGSPCIDAGDPYEIDRDGTRSDMGAFGGGGGPAPLPRIRASKLVKITSARPDTIEIANDGMADLLVTDVALIPGFEALVPLPRTIPPGDVFRVPIAYHPESARDTAFSAHIEHTDVWQPNAATTVHGLIGTPVAGEVFGIWTASNGPYRVMGAVVVPADCVLTIGPGVDVRFDADVPVAVNGRLLVLGADTARVAFRRGSEPRWKGIVFFGGDTSVIAYATIRDVVSAGRYWEHASSAVGASGAGTRVEFDHVTITRCLAGERAVMWIRGGASAKFSHCTIDGNYSGVPPAIPNPFSISGNVDFSNCFVQSRPSAASPWTVGLSYCAGPVSDSRTLFRDPASGDYHLLSDSPLIDAGDPDAPLDPDGTRADIGAYYYPGGKMVAVTESRPAVLSLSQNAPNPFNPSTAIRFSLPRAGTVRLEVYDVAGRRVRTLHSGHLASGFHEVAWDGRDAAGRPCASGAYVYRLDAGDGEIVRRMVLVR